MVRRSQPGEGLCTEGEGRLRGTTAESRCEQEEHMGAARQRGWEEGRTKVTCLRERMNKEGILPFLAPDPPSWPQTVLGTQADLSRDLLNG